MSRIERRNTQNTLLNNKSSYSGTIAFKDHPEVSNRRYIWLDHSSKEIRWSVGTIPQNPCKRLSINFIQKLSKTSSSSHFGLKIESKSHTLVFWFLNEKEANQWYIEITSLMSQDENCRSRKRATSLLQPCSEDSIKLKVLSIVNTLIPNAQIKKFEDSVEIVKNFLASSSEVQVSPEVKVLKEQVLNLQQRIKSMEEVKAEYDKYSVLEDEYLKVKNNGIDLSKKLDKIQAEKSELSRELRIIKNELSSINVSAHDCGKRSIYGGIVTIEGEHKLVNYLPELFTLFVYPLYEFSTAVEKFLYTLVKNMEMTEKSLTLTYEDSTITMIGESEVLERIKESYETYLKIQENTQEKNLIHFLSVCDESDRQLRALDRQVKGYKKMMTVFFT
jgi:hypothetical protein